MDTEAELTSLRLFRLLTTHGARWDGDVISRRWCDALCVPEDRMDEIKELVLNNYVEGKDYTIKDGWVWF